MAQNSAFVVPWIQDYHQFTKLDPFHRNASIDDVGMLERFVLPNLPDSVDGKNQALYIRLVDAMICSFSLRGKTTKKNKSGSLMVPLANYRLAARRDGRLCLASELFDHTDPVFSAAFGAEATDKFLMTGVEYHLSFWKELGIRCRELDRFEGRDYLACLLALQDRSTGFSDKPSTRDIETVLQPLCTSTGTLTNLDLLTWNSIAGLSVFPVSPVSEREPQFRRLRMELLASQRQNLDLRNIVSREYAAVCWSQTPFALHEASTFSLAQVGSRGQPSCAMVWQHLTFLAEFAQSMDEANIEGFIEDLRQTYEFLQVNLEANQARFVDAKVPIWFNAEAIIPSTISLNILRSSWSSLENLLLDSACDAPPLMTVQPFLGRFSSLLKHLGCKSVYYPPITAPSSNAPKAPFALLRGLWQRDILTDVRFEAQGSIISAHKLILASRSLYCEKQFHGPWALTYENNDSSKPIKMEGMTSATLEVLINYCYNEEYDWAAPLCPLPSDSLDEIADKLDALLDVLRAADRWVMPDLHSDAQFRLSDGAKYFIRPDNVEYVSKALNEARATELTAFCEEFLVWNADTVLLANPECVSSEE